MLKKLYTLSLSFISLVGTQAMAQGQCQVIGWASQNGGTTGGGSATPTVVTTYNQLKSAVTTASVKVVQVQGTIEIPSGGRLNIVDQTSGKTIYGMPGAKLLSKDQTKEHSGIFTIKNSKNIIFRNLILEGPGAYDVDGADLMTVENSTNLWIDHCDFSDGIDGNLDIKTASDFITITWCKFGYNKPFVPGGPGGIDDHRFSNLFGSSDAATGDRGKLRITLQHCWWAPGCAERMPWVRFGKVHIVNNYYNSTASVTCVRVGFEADLLVEKNVFENVKEPIFFASKSFTAVTASDNSFTNCTGNTKGSGTAFTPPYSLTKTAVSEVKAKVKAGAGATLSNTLGGCITTDVSEQELDVERMDIYPNPFQQFLLLDAQEEVAYSISDLSGVEHLKGKGRGAIHTESLPAGTYVVNITSPSKNLSKKMVKF